MITDNLIKKHSGQYDKEVVTRICLDRYINIVKILYIQWINYIFIFYNLVRELI
jgi:hypothetical protein